MANDKEQNKAVEVQDKKNLQPAAKTKKAQVQVTAPKKRGFTFFSDIVGELRKTVWPTRQETIRLTAIVIGICLFMALVLGTLDYGFSELVAKVFLGGK
ncbi:MAG: preprotein translocase subunit SecE [Dehalococcoidia bacterium]